jgi:hypothetical protein
MTRAIFDLTAAERCQLQGWLQGWLRAGTTAQRLRDAPVSSSGVVLDSARVEWPSKGA